MADKASLLNRVETVSIDTDTVQVSLNATVYSSSYKHQLTIHIRGVPIASVDNISWSTGTAQRTITLSACLLYTSPSPRDAGASRMPSSA